MQRKCTHRKLVRHLQSPLIFFGHVDAANDIFASVQVYQRVLGLAETDGISVDFETLLVDFSAKLDPQTGKLRDIVSKIRKGKPAVSRKKSATSDAAPRTVATSLSPRVYEAW